MKTRCALTAGLTTALILVLAALAGAGSLDTEISGAMSRLALSKGSPDLLVLTDAPFVKMRGRPALAELAVVERLTGCSVGNGNLLFFQRPQNHPLRFLLFSRQNGQAVVLSAAAGGFDAEKLDMGIEAIADKKFWDRSKKFLAGRDMFTLAAIANAWAQNAPYDFLKSAELHNHICPGLTSGYLMAQYILNRYPLSESERYTVVSSPVWCKEDALQVVLDCTPGKKGMIVKPLSAEQTAAVKIKNPAGMVLIWNAREKTGRAVALSFDMAAFKALSPEGATKAAMVTAAVPYLHDPDRFVSTGAEVVLDEQLYNRILLAGTNPYEAVGLVK